MNESLIEALGRVKYHASGGAIDLKNGYVDSAYEEYNEILKQMRLVRSKIRKFKKYKMSKSMF